VTPAFHELIEGIPDRTFAQQWTDDAAFGLPRLRGLASRVQPSAAVQELFSRPKHAANRSPYPELAQDQETMSQRVEAIWTGPYPLPSDAGSGDKEQLRFADRLMGAAARRSH